VKITGDEQRHWGFHICNFLEVGQLHGAVVASRNLPGGASKEGFKLSTYPEITVNVTETEALTIRLVVVVYTRFVEGWTRLRSHCRRRVARWGMWSEAKNPQSALVTRNYTQI